MNEAAAASLYSFGANSASNSFQPNVPFVERHSFSPEEQESINKKLNDVEQDDICFRSGVGGAKLAYMEGWKVIKIANDIFGFNGWSTCILNVSIDYLDSEYGKINAGVSCVVRVFLRDGTFHDDIGFGIAENYKSKALALEKSKKEAVTDATKRALRYFGYALGLSTYDKEFMSDLKNSPSTSAAIHASNPTSAGSMQNTSTAFPKGSTNFTNNQANNIRRAASAGNNAENVNAYMPFDSSNGSNNVQPQHTNYNPNKPPPHPPSNQQYGAAIGMDYESNTFNQPQYHSKPPAQSDFVSNQPVAAMPNNQMNRPAVGYGGGVNQPPHPTINTNSASNFMANQNSTNAAFKPPAPVPAPQAYAAYSKQPPQAQQPPHYTNSSVANQQPPFQPTKPSANKLF